MSQIWQLNTPWQSKKVHHDAHIHLHTLPHQCPTKRQPSAPYGIQEIAQTRFYRSMSLQQGQIKVTP